MNEINAYDVVWNYWDIAAFFAIVVGVAMLRFGIDILRAERWAYANLQDKGKWQKGVAINSKGQWVEVKYPGGDLLHDVLPQ